MKVSSLMVHKVAKIEVSKVSELEYPDGKGYTKLELKITTSDGRPFSITLFGDTVENLTIIESENE